MIKPTSPVNFWRTVLLAGSAISLLAVYQIVQQFRTLDVDLWRSRWLLVLCAFIAAASASAFLALWAGSRKGADLATRLEHSELHGRFWRMSALLAMPLTLAAVLLFKWKVFGETLPQLFPSFAVFYWLSLAAALGLKAAFRTSLAGAFAASLLFQGVMLKAISFLPAVSTYPFSLGWSEASRYYYASQYFSEQLYGFRIPFTHLHPTRYLLQSIPYLVSGLPLWFHRLWQVLLWLGLTGASALLLSRRLKQEDRWSSLLIAAWAFLFFFQGAVYYHLQVCVIIILAGVWPQRRWHALAAVVLASLWAGMSRVNWFPVPAMLAIALYLLEEPFSASKNLLRYLLQPVIWTAAGLGSALGGQALFFVWSRNPDISAFGSSLTSDLLWDRLFSTPTYPLGVIPGTLLVSVPLLLALFAGRETFRGWHWVRKFGLLAMGLVLFGGGLVVSTKIGGGGDLHNMDAYLVYIVVATAAAFHGRARKEDEQPIRQALPWQVVMLAMLIPVAFFFQGVSPASSYDHASTQEALQQVRTITTEAAQAGGEVLFINQRHLLTFKSIAGIELVPEYEVVDLMEMAMSHNSAYLNRFYTDLQNHRFAVIITTPQRVVIKENAAFAEENNAWNTTVAQALLCEYEPSLTLKEHSIQLLVPRKTPAECPEIQVEP